MVSGVLTASKHAPRASSTTHQGKKRLHHEVFARLTTATAETAPAFAVAALPGPEAAFLAQAVQRHDGGGEDRDVTARHKNI